MTAELLQETRTTRRLTQHQVAKRLGVSQPYWALMEKGVRKVPDHLQRKVVRLLGLSPSSLSAKEDFQPAKRFDPDRFVKQLSALQYPGFSYFRSAKLPQPGEVLLNALAQENLEARLAEALPWLLLRYSDLKQDWLVAQASKFGLQNRLGFATSLAKQVCERLGETSSLRYLNLEKLEKALKERKLAKEDTYCQLLSSNEKQWLSENRPTEARNWNVLTNWKAEDLQYA